MIGPSGDKEVFDIDRVLVAVGEAVEPFAPAALFQLAGEGYSSLFEVLIGCIISIRTRDEDALPITRRLFSHSRTPDQIAALPLGEIAALIEGCQFPLPKAEQIQAIARRTRDEHNNALPCDEALLLGFHGVGPKCANLALGIACGPSAAPHAAVDIHVHRVTNRWGYVAAPTPEKTMAALDAALPPRFRVEINRLLVPFGKHVCTGTLPRCSTCPVLSRCRQVGVASHR